MTKMTICNTADRIWLYLGGNGKQVSLTTLATKLKITSTQAHLAIGWLAREDKIKLTQRNGMVYVSLPRSELNTYRRNQILPPCCG